MNIGTLELNWDSKKKPVSTTTITCTEFIRSLNRVVSEQPKVKLNRESAFRQLICFDFKMSLDYAMMLIFTINRLCIENKWVLTKVESSKFLVWNKLKFDNARENKAILTFEPRLIE